MILKELIRLIKTEYLVVLTDDDKAPIAYFKKNELPEVLLNMTVQSVDAGGFTKQSLFEAAPKSSYVKSLILDLSSDGAVSDKTDKTEKEKTSTNFQDEIEAQMDKIMPGVKASVDTFIKNMSPEQMNDIVKMAGNMLSGSDLKGLGELLGGGDSLFGLFSIRPGNKAEVEKDHSTQEEDEDDIIILDDDEE